MRELIPLAQATGVSKNVISGSRGLHMNSVQPNASWMSGDGVLNQQQNQQMIPATVCGLLSSGYQQATGAVPNGNCVILVSQLNPEVSW